MDYLFDTAISNAVVASVLVGLLLLFGKRMKPQVVHLVWMLVLIKLITPPIFTIPIDTSLANVPAEVSESSRLGTGQ